MGTAGGPSHSAARSARGHSVVDEVEGQWERGRLRLSRRCRCKPGTLPPCRKRPCPKVVSQGASGSGELARHFGSSQGGRSQGGCPLSSVTVAGHTDRIALPGATLCVRGELEMSLWVFAGHLGWVLGGGTCVGSFGRGLHLGCTTHQLCDLGKSLNLSEPPSSPANWRRSPSAHMAVLGTRDLGTAEGR